MISIRAYGDSIEGLFLNNSDPLNLGVLGLKDPKDPAEGAPRKPQGVEGPPKERQGPSKKAQDAPRTPQGAYLRVVGSISNLFGGP